MRVFNQSTRILFADLDWTVIEPIKGATFAEDRHDWKFKVGILEAIGNYSPTHLFIVSNQGGIEKGYQTYEDVEEKMKDVCGTLERELPGVEVAYAFCQTAKMNDPMRKPNTGMLEYFVGNNDFVKSKSLMIGDASGRPGQKRDSDRRCAENFGIAYLDVFDFISQYKTSSVVEGNEKTYYRWYDYFRKVWNTTECLVLDKTDKTATVKLLGFGKNGTRPGTILKKVHLSSIVFPNSEKERKEPDTSWHDYTDI